MAIRTEGLVKRYGRREVVRGVSIEVHPGEIVGLLGPNGAGKTTTFYMIVGLVRPNAGRVFLNGEDITRLPIHQRARRGIGYLAQEPSVFRRLTVEENLLAILELQPLSRQERRERLEALLEELRLQDLRHQRADSLSGGERRRVEIARTLATQPQFLLLDEPFTGVDPIHVGELQSIVSHLREQGLGILITDHNVRETLSITDRSYIISDGRILTAGTAQELLVDPIARQVYLGEKFRM